MDRAHRAGTPLAVALLDLDHFKRLNDQYGHQAGDQLLKSATAAWQSLLRSSDLLARYGGEEFAVMLPTSTLGQAVEVVDRLRVATPLAQTFSAGVTLWHGDETSDQTVAHATTPSTRPSKPAVTRCCQLAPRRLQAVSTRTPQKLN
jgi:diguanylate cyclase (GGDEF)-like protein